MSIYDELAEARRKAVTTSGMAPSGKRYSTNKPKTPPRSEGDVNPNANVVTRGIDKAARWLTSIGSNAVDSARDSRVGNAIIGTAERRAAGHLGTFENALRNVQPAATALNSRASENRKRYEAETANAKHYREMLADGYTPDGVRMSPIVRSRYEQLAESAEKKANVYKTAWDNETSAGTGVINDLSDTGDRVSAKAEADIARGRQGLGKGAGLAYDVGTGAADLLLDAVENRVIPGLGTTGRVSRMYGQGAEKAQATGANQLQQTLTGGALAGIGEATNKLVSGNPILKKAQGAGLLDDFILKKVGGGKLASIGSSFVGEGLEEGLEDILDDAAERVIYDWDNKNKLTAKEVGYDALVGAILGGLTGISGGKKPSNVQNVVEDVQKPAVSAQQDVTEQNTPAESVYTADVEKPVESVKTSSAVSEIDNGKRVDQTRLSNEEFDTMANRGDVAMDAENRVYKVDPSQHIDQRNPSHTRNPHVNAFQFDHPELHDYYAPAAQELFVELEGYQPGGQTQTRTGEWGQTYSWRSKRQASPRIAALLDAGMTRDRIASALDAIINDHGAENYADAKRVEFILDDMLSNGYNDGTRFVPANQNYVNDKSNIPGNKSAEYGHGLDDVDPLPNEVVAENATTTDNEANPSIGAADEGFSTPGMNGEERDSKFHEHRTYDESEQKATGLDQDAYDALFKYKSRPEGKSVSLAEEVMYMEVDGERKFIRDISEDAYNDVVDGLANTAAWDGVQMDAAHMILNELKARVLRGELPQSEYTAWLKTVKEHKTSGGQGVQASAKWYRDDNSDGKMSEADALENLEKSKLPPEEQERVFQKVLETDAEIESATTADQLKDIIMRIGKERRVIKGKTGSFFDGIVRKALDSMTLDQLKQFAYTSSAAMTTDATPANIGQKIKTIQVLNMLSSMVTPSKNIAGNTSFYGLDILSMRGAALLDMVTSKMTGTRSVAWEKSPISKEIRDNALKAMQMSIAEVALDVDMGSGESRYGTGSNRTFKKNGSGVFNTGKGADKFVERVISTLERNQAYLLSTSDELYKGAARATEAQTQRLVDSGKIKTDDAEYAKNQADELAKYRTFQNNGKVAAVIQSIHDVLNILPGIGDSGKTVKGHKVHAFGLGDVTAPFTRVAGNLVEVGIDYSPVKAVQGAVEIVKQAVDAKHGKADTSKQAKAVSDAARGLTGTALAAVFSGLAQAGFIRRAEDEDDPNVAALNSSEGMRGTQINLSAVERALDGGSSAWENGDTLVDLSSIEPLNFLLNLGVEMSKDDSNFVKSSLNATAGSAFNAATELPILQSVGDFSTDVLKYGADPKETLAKETYDTLLASALPNIMASVAKATDDRPRNLYAGDGLVDYMKASAMNKIPGKRQELPGSVNTLGEPRLYEGSETNILASMLSPVNVKNYKQSDLSREMERVRKETGETVFYPTKSIPKEVKYTDKDHVEHKVSLDYDQRQKYQEKRGQTVSKYGAEMISKSMYKSASDSQKVKYLDKVTEYANNLAKESVLGSKAVPAWVQNAKTAKEDIGVSTSEYLILQAKYGSKMSGEGYENVKIAHKIGLTPEQYFKLKESANTDGKSGVNREEAIIALAQNPKRVELWDIICTTTKNCPFKR